MGLDLGSRTIGVAISDPLGFTAQGYTVLKRTNTEGDLSALGEIITNHAIETVVLGYPKNMNNSLGPQARDTLLFAGSLQESTSCKVVLWDERLTTKAAEAILIGNGMRRGKRRQVIDMVAATLILQGYLDSQTLSSESRSQEG
ncbi:MAG: Holliday junction resolvase RuvX [Symbiobacteriaceae bacterium]|nr:Holliday junction resolvase RuvX [Symbiobacteriaceae bacterium]